MVILLDNAYQITTTHLNQPTKQTMDYTIEDLIEELQRIQKNAGGWNMPVVAATGADYFKSLKRKVDHLKVKDGEVILLIAEL